MRNYLINIIHRAMETRLCAPHINWDAEYMDVAYAFDEMEKEAMSLYTAPLYTLIALAIVLPPLVHLANKRHI